MIKSELDGVWGKKLFESDEKRNQMSKANEFFFLQCFWYFWHQKYIKLHPKKEDKKTFGIFYTKSTIVHK